MTMRLTYTLGSDDSATAIKKVFKLGRKYSSDPNETNRLVNIPGFNDYADVEEDMTNLDAP